MKSQCHTGIKLAPVRVFTCKHPLILRENKAWANVFNSSCIVLTSGPRASTLRDDLDLPLIHTPYLPTTATKTSPENISLFHLCYFAIISTRSPFAKMANYPGTKLVGVAYKLRKKMKNSPSCFHVLHKTLNVVISRCCFAADGKEMYRNVKCTCKAIVFAH